MKPVSSRTLLLAAVMLAAGCAGLPYAPGVSYQDPRLAEIPLPEEQIQRGRPHRLLDASDWIWPGSWLGKLLLWDRRVDNHRIGEETEAMLERYLAFNDLQHVQVRLNQYAPRDEFRRLRQNKSVGAGWRYTVGVIGWLQYTLLPGRFFGGDHYNPYSNSISLYSDIPAVAVHEGGHAKDFANRKWKGTYGAVYIIPFVNLYHEAVASNDALGYLVAHEEAELAYEGYRIMHPAYGTYVGNNLALLAPEYTLELVLGSVLTGHGTGRWAGRGVRRESSNEEQDSEIFAENLD